MTNEKRSILTYHLETSHTRGSIMGRTLNREEFPVPFKLYRDPKPFHLSHDLKLPEVALDKVLAGQQPLPAKPNMPLILAAICNLTAGISQIRKHTDGTVFHYRTPPSAGALYPIEFYIALQSVAGMNDGLYHYCPLDHTLTQLRSGYVFGALSGTAPIIRFYLTSVYHRSAWKYGSRAYRYCLLDAGHMAKNLALATRLYGLPAQIDYDFNDKSAAEFLSIDPQFEGCLAQVHSLGCKPETEADATVPLLSADFPSLSRMAPSGEAPELLMEAHQLTSSFARCPARHPAVPADQATPLPAPVVDASASATIMNRRSRRNFIPIAAPTRDLVDVISILCHDQSPCCTDAIQVGFFASEHSGLTPGYHRINRAGGSTTLLKPGNFMAASARVCLDQSWLENAALHFVFSADLTALNKQCGPRAYRYAHLESGRLGQLAYLASSAKNMGACGVGAFFDQEAATLLDLPAGHALLYLVAVGPVRK